MMTPTPTTSRTKAERGLKPHVTLTLCSLGELSLPGVKETKPLLLLAYLALEGSASREQLAAWLWPTAKNPENNLRVALSTLNRAHPNLVEGKEDCRTTVTCDALVVLEAQGVDALTHYPAPFLQDVPLNDLDSEFEEWVYATRERLAAHVQHQLLHAAEALPNQQQVKQALVKQDLIKQAWTLPGAAPAEPRLLARFLALSEPGSALHAELQTELLSELSDMGWNADLLHAQTSPHVQALLAWWQHGSGIAWLSGANAQAQHDLTQAFSELLHAESEISLTLHCSHSTDLNSLLKQVSQTLSKYDNGTGYYPTIILEHVALNAQQVTETLTKWWPEVRFICLANKVDLSGAPMTFSTSVNTICIVTNAGVTNSGVLSPVRTGSCVVTANQAGGNGGVDELAISATQCLTIKAPTAQVLSFTRLPGFQAKAHTTAPANTLVDNFPNVAGDNYLKAIRVNNSAGVPITSFSNTPNVCAVDASRGIITGNGSTDPNTFAGGDCSITATQATGMNGGVSYVASSSSHNLKLSRRVDLGKMSLKRRHSIQTTENKLSFQTDSNLVLYNVNKWCERKCSAGFRHLWRADFQGDDHLVVYNSPSCGRSRWAAGTSTTIQSNTWPSASLGTFSSKPWPQRQSGSNPQLVAHEAAGILHGFLTLHVVACPAVNAPCA